MIISWNTTRACNQACVHCYRDAGTRQEDELDTAAGRALIEEIAKAGFKILVLSGGEPLLRPDIYDLVRYAGTQGLRPVLGTNGTLLTREVALELQRAGTARVGIGLDSTDPQVHDRFRCREGAWEQTVESMRTCREVGLPFQLHTTVTARNLDEIGGLTDLAESLGAAAHHIFFLVPTGRGKDLSADALNADQQENLLREILLRSQHSSLEIKPVCAPQFMRIAAQEGIPVRFSKGCLAGTSYCVILPNGDVHPCPYLPLRVGNVQEEPFSEIWRSSSVFRRLREEALGGACGICEFGHLCGGCRARAFYETDGDYMATDWGCHYGESVLA